MPPLPRRPLQRTVPSRGHHDQSTVPVGVQHSHVRQRRAARTAPSRDLPSAELLLHSRRLQRVIARTASRSIDCPVLHERVSLEQTGERSLHDVLSTASGSLLHAGPDSVPVVEVSPEHGELGVAAEVQQRTGENSLDLSWSQ